MQHAIMPKQYAGFGGGKGKSSGKGEPLGCLLCRALQHVSPEFCRWGGKDRVKGGGQYLSVSNKSGAWEQCHRMTDWILTYLFVSQPKKPPKARVKVTRATVAEVPFFSHPQS